METDKLQNEVKWFHCHAATLHNNPFSGTDFYAEETTCPERSATLGEGQDGTRRDRTSR